MRILLIILFSLFIISGCESKQIEERFFNFTYSVELNSSDGKKLELWLPIPQSNEVQVISNLNIDTQGLNYQIKDEQIHGNKYLYIHEENGIIISKTITINFDVARQEHKIINYSNVNSNFYLSPSLMVPTGKMFNDIISTNQLSKENMRALYDFVLSGMHYGKPKSIDDTYYNEPWLNSQDKYGTEKVSRDHVVNLYKYATATNGDYTFGNGNSLYACNIGVGNCTDYHSYFISLSRTLDVPARFHMGFPIPNTSQGEIKGYHCWADYYIEGEGWSPVDISEADKHPDKIEYFFGNLCNNRFEISVGRDLILEGYDDSYINIFVYPLLEIDDKKSNSFTKSFSFKNL